MLFIDSAYGTSVYK